MDVDFINDLAMGISGVEEIRKLHGITQKKYKELMADDEFTSALSEMKLKYEEEGVSIQKKAKALLGMHLPTISKLLTDKNINANAKVGLIRELAEIAGEKRKDTGKSIGSGFQLIIHQGTNDSVKDVTSFGVNDLELGEGQEGEG